MKNIGGDEKINIVLAIDNGILFKKEFRLPSRI